MEKSGQSQGRNANSKVTPLNCSKNILHVALASVAQLAGASSLTLKGCGFNSQSGHMPRLHIQPPVRVDVRGNGMMFLSYINVCLSPSLPLSLKSISMSLGPYFPPCLL